MKEPFIHWGLRYFKALHALYTGCFETTRKTAEQESLLWKYKRYPKNHTTSMPSVSK